MPELAHLHEVGHVLELGEHRLVDREPAASQWGRGEWGYRCAAVSVLSQWAAFMLVWGDFGAVPATRGLIVELAVHQRPVYHIQEQLSQRSAVTSSTLPRCINPPQLEGPATHHI